MIGVGNMLRIRTHAGQTTETIMDTFNFWLKHDSIISLLKVLVFVHVEQDRLVRETDLEVVANIDDEWAGDGLDGDPVVTV